MIRIIHSLLKSVLKASVRCSNGNASEAAGSLIIHRRHVHSFFCHGAAFFELLPGRDVYIIFVSYSGFIVTGHPFPTADIFPVETPLHSHPLIHHSVNEMTVVSDAYPAALSTTAPLTGRNNCISIYLSALCFPPCNIPISRYHGVICVNTGSGLDQRHASGDVESRLRILAVQQAAAG